MTWFDCNRYVNPNATEVVLEGNRHPRLVKQRQLKSQSRRKRKAEIVSVSASSCPQIWNIERVITKEETYFLLENKHENFVAAVRK